MLFFRDTYCCSMNSLKTSYKKQMRRSDKFLHWKLMNSRKNDNIVFFLNLGLCQISHLAPWLDFDVWQSKILNSFKCGPNFTAAILSIYQFLSMEINPSSLDISFFLFYCKSIKIWLLLFLSSAITPVYWKEIELDKFVLSLIVRVRKVWNSI